MKKVLMAFGLLATVFTLSAGTKDSGSHFLKIEELVKNVPQCDTVFIYNGYNVHLVKQNGLTNHIGLNLFGDEVKKATNKDILDRLETELLKLAIVNDSDTEVIPIIFVSGNPTNFKNITPETDFSITNSNSHELSVEWNTPKGSVKVLMPVNYQTIIGGSRSEIEESFISDLKEYRKQRTKTTFDLRTAEPYRDDKYIIPGSSYQNDDITRNIYLTTDSVVSPIWDVKFPLESIANLFICPDVNYGNINLDITVSKHEYGEKDIFTVPLDRFLAYCEEGGCIPFWGVEKFFDGKMEGALFLYNQGHGYDHVLKIDCIPQKVIESNESITAHASLFVPTNNVNNLFQQYINKTEKEKINYDTKWN